MKSRNRIALALRCAALAALLFLAPAPRSSRADINGTWSPIQTPFNRYGATVVVDPIQRRMVMFGGYGHYRLSDVWTMPLEGPASWTRLFTTNSILERFAHSAFYDAPRQRMIVVGGDDHDVWNSVSALSLTGEPTWSFFEPAGPAPPNRAEQAAIYDARNDRMIFFGGYNADVNVADNDVWALSLSGTPTWTKLTPAGEAPSPRFRMSAVYDSVGQQMIVFGGMRADSVFGDTWALDLSGTPVWSQIVTTGDAPAPRYRHVAILDPVRHRMIVHGGADDPVNGDNAMFGDAWSLSLDGTPTWTPLSPGGSAPTPRYRHAALYDPFGDRMILFGGSNPNLRNEVHALSLGGSPAWSELIRNNSPIESDEVPRAYYDPARNRALIHIGVTDDVEALTFNGAPRWTAVNAAGSPPNTRATRPTAFVDRLRDRLLVFGGSTRNEVWQLTLAGAPAWTQLTPLGIPPSPRLWSEPVYDPVRDRLLLYGGVSLSDSFHAYDGEVWSLSLSETPSWTRLATLGPLPPIASGSCAIYDPVGDRLMLFAGSDPFGGWLNDTWALTLGATPTWSKLEIEGPLPPPQTNLAGVYDPIRDRLVTFGGETTSPVTWALALSGAPTWSLLTPGGTVRGYRRDPSGAYDPVRDRMVTFGSNLLAVPAWTLTWGEPTKPGNAPIGDVAWDDQPTAIARYVVTNPLPGARALEWTLTSQRDWPGFPLHGIVQVGAASSESLAVTIPVPDSATAGSNTITLRLSYAGAAGNDTTNTRDMVHATTATLASLVTAEAQPGRAHLAWRMSTAAEVRVERRTRGSTWQEIARVTPDGIGNVSHDDAAVNAGERYGYRLAWGAGVVAGEVWLDIPSAYTLSLRGVSPNPSSGAMAVSFSLPAPGRASVDLCDVSGRIVEHRGGEYAAGSHVVAMAPRAIAPGVYWVRMAYAGTVLQKRVVVVR